MTVYIVGHGGYIGKSLMEYLQDREYPVRGIGRGTSMPMGFTYRDTVVNCACRGWKDGDEDPLDIVDSNVVLPMNLEKRRNGAVMIHLSSGIELLQPEHFYAATKAVASQMLQGRAHVLYLYTIFGGKHVQMKRFMSSMMQACARGEPYTIETPYHTRDFVHIDRLLTLIESLLFDREYKTMHVGAGKPTAMIDALRMLQGIAGNTFDNVTVSNECRTSFLYYSRQKTLPDTLREDMAKEWAIVNA
jgi:nucleoside-diphosphate-sugar epimerase